MLQNVARGEATNGHHQPINMLLIGGDEPTLKRVLHSIRLRLPLTSMVMAPTGAVGLAMVQETSPDLVIIHTDLKDMFPQVLVEELRGRSSVPILVISRENDETEATTALELGADDYVKFPCGMWQLAAQVWAVLRRAGLIAYRNRGRCFMISGRLFLDPVGYEVFLDSQEVHLTPTEFRLLYLLAENHGKVVSHQDLESELWGNHGLGTKSTKKHIQRLRCKLADSLENPRWIVNVYGLGYRFVGPLPQWREPFSSN